MIKKIIKLILFCSIFVICLNIVLAKAYIEDDADLLSSSVEGEITKTISKLDNSYNTNIGVLIKTINDADGIEAVGLVKKDDAFAKLKKEGDRRFTIVLIGFEKQIHISAYPLSRRYVLERELIEIMDSGKIIEALSEEKSNFDNAFKFIIDSFAKAVEQKKQKEVSKECKITDAYFTDMQNNEIKEIEEFNEVKLVVEGKDCKGKVKITLLEDDIRDEDYVETFTDLQFENDRVETTWITTRYKINGELFDLRIAGNPEFYFNMELPGFEPVPSKYSRYGLLKVKEGKYDSYNVRVTRYYTAVEEDYDKWYVGNVKKYGGKYWKIPLDERGFYEDVKVEGSGITKEGLVCYYETIKTTKKESIEEKVCKKPVEGEKLKPGQFGIRGCTAMGTNPTAHRTIAVDPKFKGKRIYVRFLNCRADHYCDGWNGIYVGEDTGSLIKMGEKEEESKIDLYVGVGKEKDYERVNKRLPDRAEIYILT